MAPDNPEKIDRGLRLNVKEAKSEKRTSVKAGVLLMSSTCFSGHSFLARDSSRELG